MEQQVLERMTATVQAARGARNYDMALALAAKLAPLFPDHAEIQQMATSIRQEQDDYAKQMEQQRKEAEFRAQTKQFVLRHRHFLRLESLQPVYAYCQGTFTITPDGVARFDCTSTTDPQGRCDHIVINRSDLKESRLNKDGSLHVATASGKFDFYGNPTAIQGSLDGLHALVQR